MLIVEPDFERRIDLPGAGPCPRPVDIDRTKADLRALVSLRVYSFAKGVAIDGEAEGDEVFIVLMRGACDFVVSENGAEADRFALRTGGPRAIYMPPNSSYRLSAVADCDIAYARCEPVGATRPAVAGFAPEEGRLKVVGHAGGMTLMIETLAAGSSHWIGAPDGRLLERFAHVRSDGGGARIGERRLGDWASAIFADGEAAIVEIEGNQVDLLTISATAR